MSRILVADDEIELVTVQQALLEALGHEIRTAMSASDALRELEQNRPDLIIVDLRFPSAADGLALIREIRQTGCQLPLIVVSGWPDDLYGTPEEGLVSRVLTKGNIRELIRTITELLPAT